MSFRGIAFDLSTSRLTEIDEDGFLSVQIAGFSSEEQTLPFEMHHTFGFLSRPRDPDPDGKGCAVLFAATGNDTHVWLADDPRVTPMVPIPKPGGALMYCAPGAFATLDGDDGAYTLYIPYADGTKSLVISVDPKDDGSVVIAHGDGASLQLTKDGARLKNNSGSAYISLDAQGINLVGPINVAGALNAGPQLMAYLTILAANTKPPSPPPLPVLSLT